MSDVTIIINSSASEDRVSVEQGESVAGPPPPSAEGLAAREGVATAPGPLPLDRLEAAVRGEETHRASGSRAEEAGAGGAPRPPAIDVENESE